MKEGAPLLEGPAPGNEQDADHVDLGFRVLGGLRALGGFRVLGFEGFRL